MLDLIQKIHLRKALEASNWDVIITDLSKLPIKELSETIKEVIGFKGGLYFNADKLDGSMKKLTDVSKFHGLGWKHKMKLAEGIKKMYIWYK